MIWRRLIWCVSEFWELLLYFLVLYFSFLVILIDSISLVEGGRDLLFTFLGGLEWPEGDGDLRCDLGSREISFSS